MRALPCSIAQAIRLLLAATPREGLQVLRTTFISFVLFSLACGVSAVAQEKPRYIQNSCVKAPAGQIEALSALLEDLSKVAQVRADEGRIAFFAAFRTVAPAGTSARCDYIFASGYDGYPPEQLTRAQAEGNFRKSGVGGTYDAYVARLHKVWNLVSNELVLVPDNGEVGSGVSVGSFIRVHLNKVKPGHTAAEWARLEREGWGAYVEAVEKEHFGFGWLQEEVVSTGGTPMEYDVLSVELLPNWASTEGGGGNTAVWNQVHPGMSNADYMAKLGDVIDRKGVELYRTAAMVVQRQPEWTGRARLRALPRSISTPRHGSGRSRRAQTGSVD